MQDRLRPSHYTLGLQSERGRDVPSGGRRCHSGCKGSTLLARPTKLLYLLGCGVGSGSPHLGLIKTYKNCS